MPTEHSRDEIYSMRDEILDQLRETFKQLPLEALMAIIEDVCDERDQALARYERIREAGDELVKAGNALSGDIAELIGIHGVEEDAESWGDPIERAVYNRQRNWLTLAATYRTASEGGE